MNPNMNGQPAQPNIQAGQSNIFNQPIIQPASPPQPVVPAQPQVVVPQSAAIPVIQAQPVAPVQPAIPQIPQPVNPPPTVITQPATQPPVIDSASPTAPPVSFQQKLAALDQDQIKKYAGVACGAFIILSVFLPFYNVKHAGPSIPTSVSIWDSGQQISRMFLILVGIIPIFTFLFQKVKRLSYISAGFSLAVVFWIYDLYEGQNLSIGIWLLLLAGIGLLALNIMEDLADIKSIFAFGGKKVTPLPQAPSVPNAPTVQTPPQALPSVGVPTAMQQPLPQPIQPAVQTIPVCGNCGQPRKVATDSFCQVCGQKY